MEQLRTLLQNVQTWFGRLTARERRLVALAGAALGAFLIFVVLYSFSSTADAYRKRTEDKLAKLQRIQALAASYRQAEQQRQSVERQLTQSNVQLISYLEEKGEQAGLDIRSMNPKGDIPLGDGRIVESAVEVTLTDVSLDRLVSFLTEVERGPGVVKVKRLRLEPRPQTETITAWTTVAAYSMKQ